jgi:membrane-associated protein
MFHVEAPAAMEMFDQLYGFVLYFIDLFLNLDVHLGQLVITLGPWLYLLLFVVIFCETGLVVTPILPGDSLLFAVGAVAALEGSPIDIYLVCILLIVAAILGDAVNYAIGRHLGPKVFSKEDSLFFSKQHLIRTQDFYEKYGGKTIVIARFVPIVRTFAPFVAGIGRMHYRHFAVYNVGGGIVWVVTFLFGGYLLGNLPAVKHNFHIVVVAIIIVSVMPAVFEFAKAKYFNKSKANV